MKTIHALTGVLLAAGILFSCDDNRRETRTEKALKETGEAIKEDAHGAAGKKG